MAAHYKLPARTETIAKKGKAPSKIEDLVPVVSLRPDPLHTALSLLENNKISKLTEGKEVTVTYPETMVAMAKSLFSSGKVYDFECHANLIISTSGAGAVTSSYGVALSITGEGSALASLFDEVKLVKAELIITGLIDPAQAAKLPGMLTVGFNPNGADSVTGAVTTASISRLPNSTFVGGSSNNPPRHLSSNILKNRIWGPIAGFDTAVPSGDLGAWWMQTLYNGAATTQNWAFIQKTHFKLRCRV